MIWEQKVNSKKNDTKNLTKTILLSKYFSKCIPNITAGETLANVTV